MADEVTREVKKERKNKHTGAKAAGGVLIAALLLGGGGYFGLGIGNPNGGLLPNQTQEAENSGSAEKEAEEVTDEKTEQEEKVLKISVKESTILYQGKEVSLSELETALLKDYKEGSTITLTDDHAIKASYDEVTALLSKLDLPYSE